jgi:fumarate reductase iron-sulfur subunit
MAMVLRVFRWSPGSRERLQKYWVRARQGMTVLDALVEVQRGTDSTLAFRYACRVGMCGSCGMVINGRERWACRTLLSRLERGPVTVRPLYHFPLIRDLVVDMEPIKRKMLESKAVFVPRRPAEDDEGFAAVSGRSRERRAVDGAIECIGCGMCVSACTMVAHDPRFPGPAALNRVFTLQRDSRDGAHAERGEALLAEDVLTRCHTQANCTAVCPMQLSPTDSILGLRRRALLQLVGVRPR